MNKFLAKYGKASIFTLIVILCMSFLIHLFSVSSGYLQSIDRQALDRAENYAGEQAVQLQEKFGALKMRADYCAAEGSEAGSLEGAVERLRSRGVLTVSPAPDNRRQRLLAFTADGQRIAAALAEIQHRTVEPLFEGFTAEEQQTLQDYLRRMDANLLRELNKE